MKLTKFLCFDDKRFVLDDGVYTLAYFHKDCNKKECHENTNKSKNKNKYKNNENKNENENENENKNVNDTQYPHMLRLKKMHKDS